MSNPNSSTSLKEASILKKLNNSNINYQIIDVWESNLEEEFAKILQIVEHFPYIAMVCWKIGIYRHSFGSFQLELGI